MDIKTADRLVELRKSNGLSQEALSEKLGVSRQAISKWERGESSPDTDNLIALARIYGITLDDILNPENKKKTASDKDDNKKDKKEKAPRPYAKTAKALFKFPMPLIIIVVYVLLNLLMKMWHPTWIIFILIPIYYHLSAAFFARTKKGLLFSLPIPEVVIMVYLSLGFMLGLWAGGAISFAVIPLYYWLVAVYKRFK